MKAFISISLILLASSHASANPIKKDGSPQCYGREYSEAHMQAHPQQTVKSMKAKFYISEQNKAYENPVAFLDLDLQVKKTVKSEDGDYVTYKPYTSGMVCDSQMKLEGDDLKDFKKSYGKSAGYIQCYIECDGGSSLIIWDIAKKSKNSITLKNHGFLAWGTCGDDAQEGEEIRIEPTEGGDDIFDLYALPAEYCQE